MNITQEWLSLPNETLAEAEKSGYQEPSAVQERLLLDILREAADTEIGRKFDFGAITSVEEYCMRMPLTEWHDVEPYSDRMVAGEADLLFPGQPKQFVMTSSTTGKGKMIPESAMSEAARDLIQKLRYARYFAVDPQLYALFAQQGKCVRAILPLTNAPAGTKTSSGIPCYYASGLTVSKADLNRLMAFPLYVLLNSDEQARDYLLMRFAIASPDVRIIVGNNAGRMTALIRMAEQRQEAILRDIEQGTLVGAGPVDEPIRAKLAEEGWLQPMPERAAALRALLAEGKPFHPSSYWPALSEALFWLSASVGRYVDELRPYLPAAVKWMDVGYGSSEAKFNIPLEPNDPSGALSIATSFFEFLPVGELEGVKPLLAHELEEGEQYELIITTWGGLYRYRMKDVVEVKGFIGKTPKIAFVTKNCEVLNICGEKLYPRMVAAPIQSAMAELGLGLRQLQIYPDLNLNQYICYVEPIESAVAVSNAVLTKRAHAHFVAQPCIYATFVEQGLLKPIEVRLMKSGWQESLYAEKLRPGISTTQIKLPVVIAKPIDPSWER